MSSTERRPIEEIADEALQGLLDGETAEAIVARYPQYGEELGALLFAAGTLKSAPQPQLPGASLAAMVARAQAQASEARKAIPVAMPSVNGHKNGRVDEIEHATQLAGAAKVVAPKKPGWLERTGIWMRPPNRLFRLSAAFALVLLTLLGAYAMARLTNHPEPSVIPVPTVPSQFSMDGIIEQIASDYWLVGGNVVYTDRDTIISGSPSVGKQVHIEGELTGDNHRVARSIVVSMQATRTVVATVTSVSTATVQVVSGPTGEPTVRVVAGPATVSPAATTAAPSGDVTVTASTRVPTSLPATQVRPAATMTRPRQNIPATTRTTAPAKGTASPPPAGPAETATPVALEPTSTAQPASTNTPAPANTATLAPPPTATRIETAEPTEITEPTEIAEPTSPPLPTVALSPTPVASHTPEPTPTQRPAGEPTNTPRPEPTETAQPNPTETDPPEPEGSATPRPTAIPSHTATTVPTSPPTVTSEPSSTEEPPLTETAEPTHEPEPSVTRQPTQTTLPTLTALPTGTGEPEETRTAQPTQTEHVDSTQTSEPTHQAGR